MFNLCPKKKDTVGNPCRRPIKSTVISELKALCENQNSETNSKQYNNSSNPTKLSESENDKETVNLKMGTCIADTASICNNNHTIFAKPSYLKING